MVSALMRSAISCVGSPLVCRIEIPITFRNILEVWSSRSNFTEQQAGALNCLNPPHWCTHLQRFVQTTVGFLSWVWLCRPDSVAPQCQVRDVPCACGRHADFHRGVRCISGSYAIQEVLHVIDSPIMSGFDFHGRLLRLVRLAVAGNLVVDHEAATVQAHSSVGSTEHEPATFEISE